MHNICGNAAAIRKKQVMGIFNFFSKEKKEILDKGLSKTKEGVWGKITRAIAGKSKIDDDVLDNLEQVFITSDVGVDTTLKILDRIQKRLANESFVSKAPEAVIAGVRDSEVKAKSLIAKLEESAAALGL